jgi:hypothetical protein
MGSASKKASVSGTHSDRRTVGLKDDSAAEECHLAAMSAGGPSLAAV